jgi:hypothetical protein
VCVEISQGTLLICAMNVLIKIESVPMVQRKDVDFIDQNTKPDWSCQSFFPCKSEAGSGPIIK